MFKIIFKQIMKWKRLFVLEILLFVTFKITKKNPFIDRKYRGKCPK